MQTKEVVKVQYSGKCSRLIQQNFTDDLDDHELLPLPSVLNRETVRSSVGSVNVYHITGAHILENGDFLSTAITISNVLIHNVRLVCHLVK